MRGCHLAAVPGTKAKSFDLETYAHDLPSFGSLEYTPQGEDLLFSETWPRYRRQTTCPRQALPKC